MFKTPELPGIFKRGMYAGPFELQPYTDYGCPARYKTKPYQDSKTNPDTGPPVKDEELFYGMLKYYLFDKEIISTEIACDLIQVGYDYISSAEGHSVFYKMQKGEALSLEEIKLVDLMFGLRLHLKLVTKALGIEDVGMDEPDDE